MSDEARVIGAILAATVELDAPLKRELARECGNRELLKSPERFPQKDGFFYFKGIA